MKSFLATTKNHQMVYVDLHSSHAATHLADAPQLLEYVKEALPQVSPEGENEFFGG